MVDNQIFVGRLPKHTRNRDLEDIFFPYGKLTRCEVKQGMRLAYGFVEFEDRRDAEDAIRQENGREFMGTRIVVEWSRGYKDKNGGRGGYDRYDRRDRDRDRYDRGGRDDRYSRRKSYSRSPPRHKRRRSPSRSRSRSYSKSRSPVDRRSRSYSRERDRSRSRS
ncbi:probable splicing factor, arginine/serine-rich 6 [Dysidea avara]|uniref:probable splicing factor, arginine/serine-rich 6 n=1 Tax=Dysidea avara TaxID=196820 RepID=UPI003332AA0F